MTTPQGGPPNYSETPTPPVPNQNYQEPVPIRKKSFYLWGLGIGILLALILALVFYKFYYPQLKHNSMLNSLNLQDAHKSRVETLQGEIDRYRQALQEDVCNTPLLDDTRPLFRSRNGAGQSRFPPSGGDGQQPPIGNEVLPPQFDEPLNPDAGDIVERSTVLVLAVNNGNEGDSMGTGFFINQNQILTNKHVVESVLKRGGSIYVTNKALGTLVPANLIVYSTQNDDLQDYAIIQIQGVSSPNYLKISTNIKQRERVGAWGYPALNVERDPQMHALINGDPDSVPEVVYTEGVVSVIQNVRGVPVVNHTAEVSHGNSGGPLVDGNGNAIAINTAIYTDLKRQKDEENGNEENASTRQLNLSLGASDFVKFLNSNNIKFEESTAS
ncbi:MAG: serine protease [Deltaproteobacteria bacterium]|jgi:V8-like Glu-specific endopeptidase|nr:serine protease [Deltaproteobacteria bacterium]